MIIKTLVATLALSAGIGPQINMEAPHRGPYSKQVCEAATVPREWVPWATCTLRRETGAVLHNKQSREDANSRGGKGRWQFLTPWQRGGPYMIADRLVGFGVPRDTARAVRKQLQQTPIYEWDGHWQDILAISVMKDGGALRHWWGACDRLAPQRGQS